MLCATSVLLTQNVVCSWCQLFIARWLVSKGKESPIERLLGRSHTAIHDLAWRGIKRDFHHTLLENCFVYTLLTSWAT